MGITVVPKEIKENSYAKFWGVNWQGACIMLKWWICKPITKISLPAQVKYQSSRSLEGSSSLRSLRARLRYSIEKGKNYKRAETARFCQKRFPRPISLYNALMAVKRFLSTPSSSPCPILYIFYFYLFVLFLDRTFAGEIYCIRI